MGSRWLLDVPDALDAAGVVWRTWPGWETKARGSGGLNDLRAIGIHHDVSSRSWSDDDGCRYCFDDADIAPIGNLYLGRSGRWTVGAAGASNSQGRGGPVNTSKGPIPEGNGNVWFLSIEAANDGQGEPWPDVQIESYVTGVAGLVKWYGLQPNDVFAHFEWSDPGKNIRSAGFRMVDPAGPCKYAVPDAAYPNMWNMDSFRGDVWLANQPDEDAPPLEHLRVLQGPDPLAAEDGPSGVITDWSTVPVRYRRVAVMRILTQRYGFPVNGAAGIVGNLEAESGIIPNRIQESKSSSPMTAPDSEGVNSTWTAQQVMDRNEGVSGPRTGGVGLAQWTFHTRRDSLFAHEYQGEVLGANILFDMDAQLDYLVHELRDPEGHFRHVDEVLRNAGVTIELASDTVLHDLVAPAVQDQAQIDKRRRFCQEALADFINATVTPDRSALREEDVAAATPSGYVFVSYSRAVDRDYVDRLVAHLDEAGVTAWVDTSDVPYGANWTNQIESAIEQCAAFVVVMTPAAKDSDWVGREIEKADGEHKPILPLLLDGKKFFRLTERHHEDVRGGEMPSDRWVEQLRRHVTAGAG